MIIAIKIFYSEISNKSCNCGEIAVQGQREKKAVSIINKSPKWEIINFPPVITI